MAPKTIMVPDVRATIAITNVAMAITIGPVAIAIGSNVIGRGRSVTIIRLSSDITITVARPVAVAVAAVSIGGVVIAVGSVAITCASATAPADTSAFGGALAPGRGFRSKPG